MPTPDNGSTRLLPDENLPPIMWGWTPCDTMEHIVRIAFQVSTVDSYMSLPEEYRCFHIGEKVRFLRLLWCNGAGMRAVRAIPLSADSQERGRQLRRLAEQGPALTTACMSLPSWGDCPAPGSGFTPVDDVRLVADLATIHQLPWHPTHAVAQVNMFDPATNGPWCADPRAVLQRVLKLAAGHGLLIRAGFEIEFVLTDAQCKPIDNFTYCSSSAYNAAAHVLDDICLTLEHLGIGVEQVHAESGPGQFEIALAHTPALEQCDRLLLAKETIVGIAHKHGLRVTFLPKYRADQAGNGGHVHLSVWKDGKNLISFSEVPARMDTHNPTFDTTFAHFLAGVVKHLPHLMCFTTPSPNSFRRLKPGCWAGVCWCWGVANKEAPIRIPLQSVEDGLFTNFELKVMDGTANPHVAVAAVVAAGIVGVRHAMPLEPPVQVDPTHLPASQLESLGIRSLPSTFADAKRYLMMDTAIPLRELLGEKLIQCLVAVRESEWKKLGEATIEEEVALLFDRY